MVKKKKYDLDDVHRLAFKGAVTVKSTDLLRHAQNPMALRGDIAGFAHLGIAGAMSEAASSASKFGKPKRDGSGRGTRANRKRNPACK